MSADEVTADPREAALRQMTVDLAGYLEGNELLTSITVLESLLSECYRQLEMPGGSIAATGFMRALFEEFIQPHQPEQSLIVTPGRAH